MSHLLNSRCVQNARPHPEHAPKPHLGHIASFGFLRVGWNFEFNCGERRFGDERCFVLLALK